MISPLLAGRYLQLGAACCIVDGCHVLARCRTCRRWFVSREVAFALGEFEPFGVALSCGHRSEKGCHGKRFITQLNRVSFEFFTSAEGGERLGGNPKLLGDVE